MFRADAARKHPALAANFGKRNLVIRATAKGWGIDNIVVHSYPHKTILSLNMIGNQELK